MICATVYTFNSDAVQTVINFNLITTVYCIIKYLFYSLYILYIAHTLRSDKCS